MTYFCALQIVFFDANSPESIQKSFNAGIRNAIYNFIIKYSELFSFDNNFIKFFESLDNASDLLA
ncbi:MAG: hypothetical protein WCS82_09390, partial [Candidatus Riflebacteria bacterium]